MPVHQHVDGAPVLRDAVRPPRHGERAGHPVVLDAGADGVGQLRGQAGRVRRPIARLFRPVEQQHQRVARQARRRPGGVEGRVRERAERHQRGRQGEVGRTVRRDRRDRDRQDAAGEQLQCRRVQRHASRGGPSAVGHDRETGPVQLREREQSGRGRVAETAVDRQLRSTGQP